MGVRACAFFPKNCWQTAPEVLSSFTFVGSSCPTCLFKEAATGDKIEEPSHTGFDISWGTGEGSMVAHISLHTKSVGKTKSRRDDDDEDDDDGGGDAGDDTDNDEWLWMIHGESVWWIWIWMMRWWPNNHIVGWLSDGDHEFLFPYSKKIEQFSRDHSFYEQTHKQRFHKQITQQYESLDLIPREMMPRIIYRTPCLFKTCYCTRVC